MGILDCGGDCGLSDWGQQGGIAFGRGFGGACHVFSDFARGGGGQRDRPTRGYDLYVVSDWFGLYAYRKEFDKRVLVIACVGMTVGVGVGWSIARYISEDWVTALVGTIAVAFSLNTLLRKPKAASPQQATVGKGMFWCTIAGFTSFVSHTGGPPYQVWTLPLGLRKAVFAGTSTIAFAYINAVKLVPYYFLGQITLGSLKTAAVLMPVAAASVYFGVWAVRRLPEALFFRIVTWSLLVIGADLIGRGLTGVEPIMALFKLFA